MGAMKPITAEETVCSSRSTPASRIASPPTPVSTKGPFAARSARATAAACRSPDTSPATKRISRTGAQRRATGQRRQSVLDLGDDPKSHSERVPSLLTRHWHRRVTAHRSEEALELQPERISLVGLERDTLHELLE